MDKETIKKYLPDILIIVGIYFLSKSIFTENIYPHAVNPNSYQYITDWGAVWGVVIVSTGVIITIRKYAIPKNSSKKMGKQNK